MPNDKKTILPADPDDLICDSCGERYPYRGDMYRTFEAARVRGWHIYQNVTLQLDKVTGFQIGPGTVETKILCPACVGTPRSKLPPAPEVLEGQADILADLDVVIEPKEKPRKDGGRAVN